MTTAELKLLKTEDATAERIAGWWMQADILPHYPCSSDTAIELLRGQEFDVNADTIHSYIDDSRIPSPMRKAGRLAWYAIDLMLLAGVLEYNRKWMPFSKRHDWKKSEFARSIEQAKAAGKSPASVFEDLKTFSVADLLLMMVNADDKTAREIMYEALKLKLGQG
jgi:hypothetical protein